MMFLAQSGSNAGGVLAPICRLLGYIIEWIYNVLSGFGIYNVGICIILFTLIIKLLLLPLTIKQQKSVKINQIAQPELNKVQKKYRGKRDQASMMKQQKEMQVIYDKYGTSPTGGCATTLIQLPIIMALYYVIRSVDVFIPQLKADVAKGIYNFGFGIDINQTPGFKISIYLLIPILSAVFQFLTARTSMASMDSDAPGAAMSKNMMLVMPAMSFFMCMTLPTAIGIYWSASAFFQFIQQVAIDYYYDHSDMDKIIEKNRQKAAKKKKKKKGASLYERLMGSSVDNSQDQMVSDSISKAAKAKSNHNFDGKAKGSGSISSKANAVSRSDKGGK